MQIKSISSYLLILIGGSVAIYANAAEEQNTVLLVLGIFALMGGLFILNASLSSKSQENESIINEEEE